MIIEKTKFFSKLDSAPSTHQLPEALIALLNVLQCSQHESAVVGIQREDIETLLWQHRSGSLDIHLWRSSGHTLLEAMSGLLQSPALLEDVISAPSVMFFLEQDGGPSLDEISEVASVVYGRLRPDAMAIFGAIPMGHPPSRPVVTLVTFREVENLAGRELTREAADGR